MVCTSGLMVHMTTRRWQVELVPGGANIQITTANVEEYVGRMLYYEATVYYEPLMRTIRQKGFTGG